jgi:hypothetical protein
MRFVLRGKKNPSALERCCSPHERRDERVRPSWLRRHLGHEQGAHEETMGREFGHPHVALRVGAGLLEVTAEHPVPVGFVQTEPAKELLGDSVDSIRPGGQGAGSDEDLLFHASKRASESGDEQ